MTGGPAVLVLSTADWDRPLWTNKQHLSVQLAARGADVTYVNSIGARVPGLSIDDLARAVGRIRKLAGRRAGAGAPTAPPPPNVTVVTPAALPFHRRRSPIWPFNRLMVRRAVARWLAAPRHQRVLWAFMPVTYGLEDEAAATVYHCVDLLAHFPGVDGQAFAAGEANLAARGVPAIASSRGVARHLEDSGFGSVRLWENVADTDRFRAAARTGTRTAGAVVYGGNLTPHKVDFDLLRAVARLPGVTLHIAGPVAEGGGDGGAATALLTEPGIVHHGTLTPDALAALFARCTVGLIPYLANDYTGGVFPMKTYEYLAAGLAVVSTPLPSLTSTTDVHLADGEAFVAAVAAEQAVPDDAVVARRWRAAEPHSWPARGDAAMALIEELLAR